MSTQAPEETLKQWVDPNFTLPVFKFNHEKFFSKVSVDQDSGCWNWMAARDGSGYGVMKTSRKLMKSHRLSYSLFISDITPGFTLDHTCKNRACCNPDHLKQVTMRENTLNNSNSFASLNASKTHCPQGHEYAGENLRVIITPKGNRNRSCKICTRLSVKKYKERIKNGNK